MVKKNTFVYLPPLVGTVRDDLSLCLLPGDNGRIKFSIEAGDDSNDFEILHNGTILTRNLLDRELKTGYNLIVRATDCAPDPDKRLSSTVQVRPYECFINLRLYKVSQSNKL